MKKKIFTCLLIISLINTLSPFSAISPAFAGGQSLTMEVIEGPVFYKTSRDVPWNVATGSLDLQVDYNIHVGTGGSALLHYPDGSTARLFEKSMVEVISVSDVEGTKNYNVRFIGQVMTSPKVDKENPSVFLNDSPAVLVHSKVEYMAELKSDMSLEVVATTGEVPEEINVNPGYNVSGTVKEIFPQVQMFTLEIDKDNMAIVAFHPHTIVKTRSYDGYVKYRDSGETKDLGDVEDLSEGEEVVVFGEAPIELIKTGKAEGNTPEGVGSAGSVTVASDGNEEIREIEFCGHKLKVRVPGGVHIVYILTPLITNHAVLPAYLANLRVGGVLVSSLGKGTVLTGLVTGTSSTVAVIVPLGILAGILIPVVASGDSTTTVIRPPVSKVQPNS